MFVAQVRSGNARSRLVGELIGCAVVASALLGSVDHVCMRRLRIGQSVGVSLDGEVESIECCVVSVLGPVATLDRRGALDRNVAARLSPGALGFMVFGHRDVPVALRGVASSSPRSFSAGVHRGRWRSTR